MHGYVPGLQKNDPEIIKLNSNENPYPPSEKVFHALHRLSSQEASLQKYPPPRADALRASIEKRYNLPPGSVLVGNGSDEILALLFRGLLDPGQSFIMPDPTYSLYPILADATGLKPIRIPLNDFRMPFTEMQEKAAGKTRVAILAMPNAPTGIYEKSTDLEEFISGFPGWVILDEAYAPFSGEQFMSRAGTEFPNLICTCTFSKAWALAGLRIGWMAAHPLLIEQMDKIRDSYNLSLAAQIAARAAIEDVEWQEQNAARICATRDRLFLELERMGFVCQESSANFVFARVPDGTAEQARALCSYLESRGILIRHFRMPGIEDHVRISVGTDAEIHRLLQEIPRGLEA